MKNTKIVRIHARQILDSRATPTIETVVELDCGAIGIASVPSGASTGKFEANERRDRKDAYLGKGVKDACHTVNTDIAALLHQSDACDQAHIDDKMCRADGSENKDNFGANAILSVSLAAAKAGANAYRMPLYRYLGGICARTLPMPMMNIINGGAHSDNSIDIQEFMICPIGANSFSDAIRMGAEIYAHLKLILKEDEFSTSIGDEGGFAPNFDSPEMALHYLTRASEFAGYTPGRDVAIALDVAASQWYTRGEYHLTKSKKRYSKDDLIAYYKSLTERFPIISIEDPLHEEDFEGFAQCRNVLDTVQIVGDDLFTTNINRLKEGIARHSANAILIKPNQIGTLSQTLSVIDLAHKAGMKTILSHRSGETNDSTIADIAVAANCAMIKSGAPARGERVIKYNRLLEIEEQLYH